MKDISKYLLGTLVSILVVSSSYADTFTMDTVILKFENNVSVVVIADSEDNLDNTLKYDFNEIFESLKYRTRIGDDGTVTLLVADEFGSRYLKDTSIVVYSNIPEVSDEDGEEEDNYDDDYDYEAREREKEKQRRRRTRNYYNIDLGMNNYLMDGSFPDETNELYTVRPWGSWYFGIATLFKTNVVGPLYVEWGGGIDWYAFKFENSRTRIDKTDVGLDFFEDTRTNIDPIKSKLSIAYVSARFVPVFDFSKRSRGSYRLWNSIGTGFRIGFGGYVSYRIDSWTKSVYKIEGDKERDRDKSNFYLNNLRYGARAQLGWKGIDIFVNYDLNDLFIDTVDTPKLNAFSFGFVL